MKRFVFILLFCFLQANSVFAENYFYKFWHSRVLHFAQKHLPEVEKLSETEKQDFFKTDEYKSVAILLYEFIEPKRASKRYFDTSHALSKSLLKSKGFGHVINHFKKQKSHFDSLSIPFELMDYRYVMSPRKGYGSGSIAKQTLFSIKEHIRLACRPNITQLFLGSYLASVSPLEGSWVSVKIENVTSRNSLFLHIPSSISKPNMFGSVEQEFNLVVNLDVFK